MDVQTKITPLQQLILEHMAATGETYADLAKRGGLPRQTLQAIVQRESKAMPRPATLVAVADALQLPLAKVQQAAAASAVGAGEQHPLLTDDPLTVLLLRAVDDLSPEHRQVLLATARALKKAETAPST